MTDATEQSVAIVISVVALSGNLLIWRSQRRMSRELATQERELDRRGEVK